MNKLLGISKAMIILYIIISIIVIIEMGKKGFGFEWQYWLGFIGAVVGGSLTLIGVKITLDNQEKAKIKEKDHHRMMFFMHLKSTFDKMEGYSSKGTSGVNDWLISNAMPNVPNWEERLLYIDNLDIDEIKTIFNFLSEFEQDIQISPFLNQHTQYQSFEGVSGDVKTIEGIAIISLYNLYGEELKNILRKYLK